MPQDRRPESPGQLADRPGGARALLPQELPVRPDNRRHGDQAPQGRARPSLQKVLRVSEKIIFCSGKGFVLAVLQS